MAAYTQANRPLTVTTPLGPDVLLLEKFSGSEAISEPYSFRLDMLCAKADPIGYGDLLGQKVTVEIRTNEGKNKRYFHGIINRLSQGSKVTGQDKTTFIKYQAELVPQLWLLSLNRNSRIFQSISVPDILKEILQKQWSLDVSFQLQGTFLPRDYCVQYDESDFDFVSRLMEEEGIFYFFIHKEDGHQLVLANSPRCHPDLPGIASVPFEEEGGGHPDANRVTEWIKHQEIRAAKTTLWDYCFELPSSHLDAQETVLGKTVTVGTVNHPLQIGGNQKLELYEYPGEYAQRFDGIQPGGGDRSADVQHIFTDNIRTCKIRIEQETVQALAVEGAGHCWQFNPGTKFNLKNHFDADGQYVLTRVGHSASMEGAYTSGTAETPLTYRNTFTCIPLALPFRPQRKTPKPQIVGPQTAVVVGPKGEEIFCDQYGRVKVQFHWDRLGKNDANSSCWVRVAQIWAGKGWGAFFWPRIGHEVVVSFEEGNIDRPLIIGSVYNSANMPPFPLPLKNLLAGIKSATVRGQASQDYNGLIFVDEKDQEHVAIHSEHDLTLHSETSKSFHAGQHQNERVNKVSMTMVGNLPLGGGSGGGPDDKNPLASVPAQGVLGANSIMVYGENLQAVFGFNHQFALGCNWQLCVNPLGLASLVPGWPSSPAVSGFLGGGIGGNIQLTIGTNTNVVMGQSFNVTLGPDAADLKNSQGHTVTFILVGVLGALVIVWLILYAALTTDNQRHLQLLMQIPIALVLAGIVESELIYKKVEAGTRDLWGDMFASNPYGNEQIGGELLFGFVDTLIIAGIVAGFATS